MQKLIDSHFFCYPKHQNLSLIYKDVDCLKSKLFLALSLQISPKEGFLLRLKKSRIGHYLGYLQRENTIEISFLEKNNIKVGYLSNNKILLFGFDENNHPIEVLKKNADDYWEKTPFLGYTIIEKYSKKEYFKKRELIKNALEKRWKDIECAKDLHGDFTHFNILISSEKKITFIDEKECKNSKLFDHFYFYSYFVQCLERCTTISVKDIFHIKSDLQKLIKECCRAKNMKVLLTQLDVKDAVGLLPLSKKEKIIEFTHFLLEDEK